MIGLPRKRDGNGILPSYDIERFFILGNLSCQKYEMTINFPETEFAPLKVLENFGRKEHVNGSLYHGASLGPLSVQSIHDH
jgi:hypothetical protein